MYFITDWAKRVDFEAMREKRLKRAKQSMEKFGLDGLLVFKYENVRYLTSLRPLWMPGWDFRNAAAITRNSKEPICWPLGGDWPHRKTIMTWLKPENIRPFPGAIEDSPDVRAGLEVLKTGLKDLGLKSGRIGVDLTYVHMLDQLREIWPDVEVVDGEWCMRDARTIKTDEEVELMRVGCIAVEACFDAVFRAIAPGKREYEIMAEGARILFELGGETMQSCGIVASGPNTAPMVRFSSDRLIQNGDLVFIDMGACYNGIFAEATRTAICGKANDQQKAIYKAVYEMQQVTFGAMKQGVKAADVQDAAAVPYKKSGFVGYFQRGPLVHGIGVSAAEPPRILPPDAAREQWVLEKNMTFSVVPTILVPGVSGGGGVRLEDQLVVTETGVEIMTKVPYDEDLLA